MKKTIIGLCLLASSFSMAATRLVWAPIDYIYVPKGFDNNDSVEVVVTGYFPSPCYSRNTVKVDVVNDQIKIEITALLSDDKFKWCPEMVVPYQETVAVGNLQAGDYKILVNDKSKNYLKDKLTVKESPSAAINDFVYAAVEYVERVGETNQFKMKGVSHTDCWVFDRFEYSHNSKDTIVILPIMKKIKKICPFIYSTFEYTATIDFTTMQVDNPLLHVRTQDGKSVNRIVNLGDSR